MPWPTTQCQHGGQASHSMPRRPFKTLAGLIFRPPGLYTFIPGAAERTPRNLFFPTLRWGFCTPWAVCFFPVSTAAVPTVPAETTSEDRPLTSPPPRPVLGGGALATPQDPDRLQMTTYLARCVQGVPCTVNSLSCLY
jgi:hypothetical protein